MVGSPESRSPVAVLAAGALALAALVAGVLGPFATPASAASPTAHRVVIVGVPGLRWSDLTADGTPVLWRLAGSASLGALSVRSAAGSTRRGDGWLTLGAGDRARAFAPGTDPLLAATTLPDARDPAGLRALLATNDRSGFGARIGALGGAVRAAGLGTAAAGGAGAFLGAMDGTGTVDDQLGADAPVSTAAARLVMLELPDVYSLQTGSLRDAALRSVDARLGRVAGGLGPEDLLVVLGVSDREIGASRLDVAMVKGPGFGRRWLTSESTRHQPIVQLVDVAPTVLTALGLAVPREMIGGTLGSTGPPVSADATASTVTYFDQLAGRTFANSRLGGWFPSFFGWLGVVLAALGAAYLWAGRERSWLPVVACTVAAIPLATWLLQLLPWWRWGGGGVLAAVPVLAVVVGLAAALGPWRRSRWGPAAVVGLLSAGVMAVDVSTGSHLQLDAPFGDNPVIAGRFHGMGNGAFAVLGAGTLVAAVALGARLPRRQATAVVLGTGLVAVGVDGHPALGDDLGGVMALLPAVLVLAVLVSGASVRAGRALAVVAVTAVAVAGFAGYDYSQPPERRSHLGRFVQELRDGSAGSTVGRKLYAAERTLASGTYRWQVLAFLAVAVLAGMLIRRGRLTVVEGEERRLVALVVSVAVLGVLGGALNDSGLLVTTLVWWVGAPLLLLLLVPRPATAPGVAPAARRPLESLTPDG